MGKRVPVLKPSLYLLLGAGSAAALAVTGCSSVDPKEIPRGTEMYEFLRGLLAWTATVAVLWPVNVPLAALAFKITHGQRPLDMETSEFWTRSTFAALGVSLLTLAMLIVDYWLAVKAEFPAGPIHLAIFMAYVPAAVFILFVFFALDDLLQALGLFVLYIYLPVLVLYVLNLLVGWWDPLVDYANEWLKAPA